MEDWDLLTVLGRETDVVATFSGSGQALIVGGSRVHCIAVSAEQLEPLWELDRDDLEEVWLERRIGRGTVREVVRFFGADGFDAQFSVGEYDVGDDYAVERAEATAAEIYALLG